MTLDDLPVNIVIEVQGRMTKDFPGLPTGQFPIVPRTSVWNLYNSTDTQVTIHTKGFAVSPYFSSTIDSITGRNLDKGILDLSSWEVPTKYSSAMKAYIGLSRVRKADDILIAQIMSPTLFSCGAHPWPTRLLQVLRRERQRPDSEEC